MYIANVWLRLLASAALAIFLVGLGIIAVSAQHPPCNTLNECVHSIADTSDISFAGAVIVWTGFTFLFYKFSVFGREATPTS